MGSRSDEIRKVVETKFQEILRDRERRKVIQLERRDAYGHEAGIPIEEWVKDCLEEIDWEIHVYFPNVFLEKFFSSIGNDENKLKESLQQTWWGFKFGRDRLLVTEKQIKDFVRGNPIGRWQQEAGDIVLFYGSDIIKDANDVILLNVKSHYIERRSRPPNIMSAERLLKFFNELLNRNDAYKILEKVNLWFIGVGYATSKNGTIVTNIHTRDLLLLDISKLPQINFDAAIQMQWHVKDMVEIEQDRLSFVENLADTFMMQWKSHVKGKQERYESIAENLKEVIERLRNVS
ncbi:MAG: HincII family type II restriction endonuclease [Candidatus Methanospirareceae archaeon]